MKHARQRFFALMLPLVSLFSVLVLFELGTRALVAVGWLRTPRPAFGESVFWDGRHPVFGVWHFPGVTARHTTGCFDVEYHTNAIGARDTERERIVRAPRVVVLGDSFLEGWGLPAERRLTNLLESATGMEHINLAMSHFGPYQEYLAYHDLGRRYSHSAVMIGILPFNDFFDLDYRVARHSPGYCYRYRPYLEGKYPDYHPVLYQESSLHSLLRKNSYGFNALSMAYMKMQAPVEGFDRPPSFEDSQGIVHSFFYDYDAKQFLLLRYCLERITAELRGKQLVVVLIPAPPDFLRARQSGDDPLARELRSLDSLKGAVVVDLLAEMFGRSEDWSEFYFTCDHHWNERGNALAASLLEEDLAGTVYRPHVAPDGPPEVLVSGARVNR